MYDNSCNVAFVCFEMIQSIIEKPGNAMFFERYLAVVFDVIRFLPCEDDQCFDYGHSPPD